MDSEEQQEHQKKQREIRQAQAEEDRRAARERRGSSEGPRQEVSKPQPHSTAIAPVIPEYAIKVTLRERVEVLSSPTYTQRGVLRNIPTPLADDTKNDDAKGD